MWNEYLSSYKREALNVWIGKNRPPKQCLCRKGITDHLVSLGYKIVANDIAFR